MKKSNLFFILSILILVLSGCSVVGLTQKDKIDIEDGIKTVHSEGSIPDVWKSENGIDISVLHKDFGQRADGIYCMTASVKVGNEEYLPPTPLCNIDGKWLPVSKTEFKKEPAVTSPKIVQKETETILPEKNKIVVEPPKKIVAVPDKLIQDVKPILTKKVSDEKTATVDIKKSLKPVVPVKISPRTVAGRFTEIN